jgi:hypothetical protein
MLNPMWRAILFDFSDNVFHKVQPYASFSYINFTLQDSYWIILYDIWSYKANGFYDLNPIQINLLEIP